MIDKFFETIGEDLAKRWLDYLFGPAFLFWGGGVGLYIWQKGWEAVRVILHGWVFHQQAAAVLIALLVVFISSLTMQAVQLPVIRFLEGHWPWPLNHLANYIVFRNKKDFRERYRVLRQLKLKEKSNTITPEEQDNIFQLENWAHSNPPSEKDLLPTRLGNMLRARELASSHKYGLDALICWPRLWCLLPECICENLTSSRDVLNQQAELWLWGLLFLVWTALSPLVVLISFVWMFLAYNMVLHTAAVYGDLIETTFDLHRFALYDALGWPRPKGSDEEKTTGAQLTEFLWRGTAAEEIFYAFPAAGGKGQ